MNIVLYSDSELCEYWKGQVWCSFPPQTISTFFMLDYLDILQYGRQEQLFQYESIFYLCTTYLNNLSLAKMLFLAQDLFISILHLLQNETPFIEYMYLKEILFSILGDFLQQLDSTLSCSRPLQGTIVDFDDAASCGSPYLAVCPAGRPAVGICL